MKKYGTHGGRKYSLDISKLSLYPNFLKTAQVVSVRPRCINKLCRNKNPFNVTAFAQMPSSTFFLNTALTSSKTCGWRGALKQHL